VCFIENIDAMGVHTGDSLCAAPMLTIDKKLQAILQDYSYAIVDAIGVIGGTNIQFAHDPKTGRVVVIEINRELHALLLSRPRRQASRLLWFLPCSPVGLR